MKLKIRERYVLESSDYSQQEPKILAQACGDERMIKACIEGKDLYATIGSVAYHTVYENCLEFYPKGTPLKRVGDVWEICNVGEHDKLADGETDKNYEGKKRRDQSKKILLGIMYGRTDESVAEQLGCSLEEARSIKELIYNSFPSIKKFEDDNYIKAYEKGYVTTLWGRKRRLPDLQLPDYTVTYTEDGSEVPSILSEPIINRLNKIRGFDSRKEFIDRIRKEEGIKIVSNYTKKSEAKRQIINSIIQGCISGDSVLITKHCGNRPIKELVNTSQIIWDGLEWTDSQIVSSGKKQKYAITLEDGSTIECSKDHRFLVKLSETSFIWKRCEYLLEGDDIIDIKNILEIDNSLIPLED